jgi:parallel beta-helix repeat protein
MDLHTFLALQEINHVRQKTSTWYNVKEYGAKGDGTAMDRNAIQKALDEAGKSTWNDPNGFSIVYVPKGRYILDDALLIGSNITLLMDENAVLERGNNTMNNMLRNKVPNGATAYNGNSYIRIIGGVFDGRKDLYTSACTLVGFIHCFDIRIENTKFRNLADWHFLELNCVSRGKVLNATFENYGDNGATVVGTEMLQIDLAIDASAYPWDSPAYDGGVCRDIEIRGCLFRNGTDGVGSHSAIAGVGHYDIKIVNNKFENMSGQCVKTLNYMHLLVDGNYFTNVEYGVRCSTSGGGEYKEYHIVNNIFFNIARTINSRAIMISSLPGGTSWIGNGVISGNSVDTCARHGIGIDYCYYFTISNNVVQKCQQTGIWVYGGSQVTVTGNTATKNNLSATSFRADIAIGVATSANKASSVNCQANTCGTLYYSDIQSCMIRNNVASTSLTGANATTSNISENLVNGSFV